MREQSTNVKATEDTKDQFVELAKVCLSVCVSVFVSVCVSV